MPTLDIAKNLNPLSLAMGSSTALSTPAVLSTPPAPITAVGSALPVPIPKVQPPTPVAKEPVVLGTPAISEKITANKEEIKKRGDTGLRTDAAGNITYADGTLYKANESVYANPDYTSSPQQDIQKVADGAATAGDFGKDAKGNVLNMRTGQIVQMAPGTFQGDGKPGETASEGVALGSTDPRNPNYVLNPNSPAYNPAYFDENPELDPRYRTNFQDLDALKAKGDAFFAREIENIKQQYESLINQQKDANMRSEASRQQSLLMAGTSRYAPLNEIGILHEEVSFGKQKVADLLAKESAALIAAEKAQQEQDYKLADKKLELYKEARTERNKEMTKIYDTIQKTKEAQIKAAEEQKKVENEQKKELETQRSDILKDVGKNNAPSDVITAVANAKSVSDMVKAAGEWLQTASGDLGEALAIKRSIIAGGGIPPSIEDLLIRVANQKAVRAAVTIGRLTSAESLIVDKEIRSLEGNHIVKNFIEIQNRYHNVLRNVGKGDGATDLAYIFDLMKILDPTSVVRETEYATGARQSGNIFAGKLAYLNGLIDPKGGFVSESAKQNILGVMKNRFETNRAQYINIRNEKIRTLGNRGIEDAGDFLPEYDFEDSNNVVNQVINEGEQAKSKVMDYAKNNPEQRGVIKQYLTQNQPEVGRPFTYDEIKQLLGI